tara:strand:+ start:54 stop:602 length:549 start_codon:yes stop_codon:yes gene_type:complete
MKKSDFNLHEFPVDLPIFSTILEDHVEFNKYLKEVIVEHRKKFPQSRTSTIKAWHTGFDTHILNSNFEPICERTLEICKFLCNEYYGNNYSFYVHDLWVMMYERGDKTEKHNHFPSVFSCTYYVDVDDKSSPIIFENNKGKLLSIQPVNGMLLIWGSLIKHMVLPTDGKRIVISMNITDSYF